MCECVGSFRGSSCEGECIYVYIEWAMHVRVYACTLSYHAQLF